MCTQGGSCDAPGPCPGKKRPVPAHYAKRDKKARAAMKQDHSLGAREK